MDRNTDSDTAAYAIIADAIERSRSRNERVCLYTDNREELHSMAQLVEEYAIRNDLEIDCVDTVDSIDRPMIHVWGYDPDEEDDTEADFSLWLILDIRPA